jgi:hypothetical protein
VLSWAATDLSLKHKQVKPLIHIPFTQSLKQSVPIYFPLKSWPALVPVDQNHMGHRGRGCITLDTLQSSAGPLQRFSPCWLLTLITLGLPTWSRCQVWISISLHQSKGLVCSSAVSFSRLEGDPGITSGVCTSWFQGPPQAAQPGRGDRYPMGLGGLISLGPPEMLQEECQTTENKTLTQVVGGKEDLLC